MYWHENGSDGWGAMMLIVLISWLVVAALTYAIARSLLLTRRRPPDQSTARAVLDQRLARGELKVEDYRTLRTALTESAGP